MADKPQTNPDVFYWLERALLQQRCDLELRHQDLLSDFAERFGSPPSQDLTGGNVLGWQQVDCAKSDAAISTSGVCDHASDTTNVAAPLVVMGDEASVPLPPDIDGSLSTSPNVENGNSSPLSSQRKHRRQSTIVSSTSKSTPVWASDQNMAQRSESLYQRYLNWISSPAVELTISCIIAVSAVILGMEMQWRGLDTGNLVGYTGYIQTADEGWPWASAFFAITEMVLGVFFACELVLKVSAQHVSFFKDCWNWIDVVIVGSWLGTMVLKPEMGFNPIILRLLRLMRLLRLLRLLGMIAVFDSLYLMTTAIQASLNVLVWAVLVLTVVEMACACLLQSAVEDYLRDPSNRGTPQAQEVYKFYGSFARSMLTMFELTLGNWMPPTRALVEHVNESYMLFFLVHKFVIGFCVVSVITSVFIQETFEVAQNDDQIMLNNKRRAVKKLERKMRELFEHADADGDGSLDRDEFMSVMHDNSIRKWLSSMGLDVDDAAAVFEQLHGGDGHITAPELMTGAAKLRGSARSIDLLTHMSECRQSHVLLKKLNRTLTALLKEGDSGSDGQGSTTPVYGGEQNHCKLSATSRV